jgi:anion-transporting  ArsA/GET3 family ATPase
MTAGVSLITGAVTKVVGAQFLRDVQTFVAAFDTLFGGFRQRAQKTYRLLQADGTAFLVVAAPEPDALREASYFVERLAEERMPLAGLVVNRVHESAADGLSAARSQAAAETLEERGEHTLTAALLRLHTARMQLAAREERLRDHFASTHPTVPVTAVPAQAEDVHDLDGLRLVGEDLAAPTSSPSAA